MSEYLILIYGDESHWSNPTAEMGAKMMKGHEEFGMRNEKSIRGGNALQPTTTATSLRETSPGNFVVTDGAFAETKEALAGYYLVEAADLDEAIELAKQVPSSHGGLEVRPIRVFG
ncbi:MAG TPA: YciI family protein [Acidimicrobiales bacterium]